MTQLSKSDRDALIQIAKERARQGDREIDARRKVLIALVLDQVTAEYSARDELWAGAIAEIEEMEAKVNAQIRDTLARWGIPAKHAPRHIGGWLPRSSEYADRNRRAELTKLAEARLDGIIAQAKAKSQAGWLDIRERLITEGLDSDEARSLVAAMPTVEQLLPPLTIEDLGLRHWHPPIDAAGQLLTPSTTVDLRRRAILQAIRENPALSDRAIAKLAGVDHKTVAAARRRGEAAGSLPTGSGESGGEFPTPLQLIEPADEDEGDGV
jgi:hypothetical protein